MPGHHLVPNSRDLMHIPTLCLLPLLILLLLHLFLMMMEIVFFFYIFFTFMVNVLWSFWYYEKNIYFHKRIINYCNFLFHMFCFSLFTLHSSFFFFIEHSFLFFSTIVFFHFLIVFQNCFYVSCFLISIVIFRIFHFHSIFSLI